MRFCPARPELPISPLVKAVVASTRTSRGHKSRCASTAESAASASPATSKSKNAIWLASRARQIGGEGVGRRHRSACRRRVPALQQRVRLGGMGEGKARICGDRTIERLDRAGIHGQLGFTALYVSIPRGGRIGGQREFVSVRQHDGDPIAAFRLVRSAQPVPRQAPSSIAGDSASARQNGAGSGADLFRLAHQRFALMMTAGAQPTTG